MNNDLNYDFLYYYYDYDLEEDEFNKNEYIRQWLIDTEKAKLQKDVPKYNCISFPNIMDWCKTKLLKT